MRAMAIINTYILSIINIIFTEMNLFLLYIFHATVEISRINYVKISIKPEEKHLSGTNAYLRALITESFLVYETIKQPLFFPGIPNNVDHTYTQRNQHSIHHIRQLPPATNDKTAPKISP